MLIGLHAVLITRKRLICASIAFSKNSDNYVANCFVCVCVIESNAIDDRIVDKVNAARR